MREMKDSGIPWIGEIPKDWKVDRMQVGLHEIVEKNSPIKTDYILSLTNNRGVIPYDEKGDIGNKSKENIEDYKVAYPNTIVANSMNILIGSVGICNYYGCVSPVYYVFEATQNGCLGYLNYIMSSEPFQKHLRQYANGILEIRLRLSSANILKRYIPFPSLAEQQRIAEFLDRKCAEVDEMIGLQEQIIEELKAYKQSVITEAVTKGLNPDAPMRDSGIEWIGQIPEHWEVKRLKFVAERHNQKVSDEVLPYIGLENVESFSERFIETENEYDITQAQVCAVGDVIFGKLRPYLGKAMVIKTEHCCSSEFLVLSGSGAPSYLRYLMLSDWFVEIVNASTYGTKMPRANADYIMNMQVVCPSIEERKAIADYLDEKCVDIDSLIQIKLSKIDSLKEYKKSIIYEYVTGKREVE